MKENRAFKSRRPRKANTIKLTKIEKCLFALAVEIEAIPYCDVRVKDILLGILGYEEVKPSKAK